jgi:hypothetical protein
MHPVGRVEDGRSGLGRSASPCFPSPLIKPGVRISRIRLSDWFGCKAHDGSPVPEPRAAQRSGHLRSVRFRDRVPCAAVRGSVGRARRHGDQPRGMPGPVFHSRSRPPNRAAGCSVGCIRPAMAECCSFAGQSRLEPNVRFPRIAAGNRTVRSPPKAVHPRGPELTAIRAGQPGGAQPVKTSVQGYYACLPVAALGLWVCRERQPKRQKTNRQRLSWSVPKTAASPVPATRCRRHPLSWWPTTSSLAKLIPCRVRYVNSANWRMKQSTSPNPAISRAHT